MSPKILISTMLGVVVLSGIAAGGYFLLFTKEAPVSGVSMQALQEGSEVTVSGTFLRNGGDSETMPNIADGAWYQVVSTEQYGQIEVVVGGGRAKCLAGEIDQPMEGESVEVFAQAISAHRASVCSSLKYYIKKK